MSDHDDLLRSILDDEAASIDPGTDWDDVRRRATRRRWQTWLPAAAAVLVVALVGAVLLLPDDGDESGVATTPETTTTAAPDTTDDTAATSTTTTTPDPGTAAARWSVEEFEAPPFPTPVGQPLADDEVLAVVDSLGPPPGDFPTTDVAVLSTTTGEVVRRLATDFSGVEGGVMGLTLSPDRRTAYWTYSTSACTARIEAAAADGSGQPLVAVDGANAIAFDETGTRVAVETGDACVSPTTVEVRPLDDGTSTRLTAPEGGSTSLSSIVLTDDHLLATPYTPSGPVDPLGSALSRIAIDTGAATVGGDDRRYSRLHRSPGGPVTALAASPDGSTPTALVVLDGTEVVDRRPVDVGDPLVVRGVGLDPEGRVFVVGPGLEDPDLVIAGETVAGPVYGVGF